MSPTRRQIIGGLFGAAVAAVAPLEASAAPVEPVRGVASLMRGREERNAFLELMPDGRLMITRPSNPDQTIVFQPCERLAPAEWIERMMSEWPQG